MEETFRQSRKPVHVEKPGGESEAPPVIDPTKLKPKDNIHVTGPMPAALQDAIRRKSLEGADNQEPPAIAASVMSQNIPSGKPPQHMPLPQTQANNDGPRLAFTGNVRLDELLAGIRETVFKYESIQLPSMGKFYTPDVLNSPDGEIHVHIMTGEEEEILGTPRYIKKGLAINMIFQNCVREKISADKLLSVDRTYLLIFLRGISYGSSYDVELKCTECNGPKFSTTIDLDSLLVRYCPENFTVDNLNDVLPTSKYKFKYRLATGKDENLISEYSDRRKRQQGDNGQDDTWTFRAALLTDEIEGLTDKQALQVLISRLPINDVAYLRSCINEPPFSVETKVKVLCPFCTEEFEVDMPMETNFFFPKPKRVRNIQV